MLLFHDGPGTTYASVVFEQLTDDLYVKEGRKYRSYIERRLTKGPAIHAQMISSDDRRAIFVTLVRAAKVLNQAIIAICADETEALLAKSGKRKKS